MAFVKNKKINGGLKEMSKAEREIRKQGIDLQRSYIDHQLKNGNPRYVGDLYAENKLYFARRGYISAQILSEEERIKFDGIQIHEFYKTA